MSAILRIRRISQRQIKKPNLNLMRLNPSHFLSPNSPEDEDCEWRIVVAMAMEFISDSGDHIMISLPFALSVSIRAPCKYIWFVRNLMAKSCLPRPFSIFFATVSFVLCYFVNFNLLKKFRPESFDIFHA